MYFNICIIYYLCDQLLYYLNKQELTRWYYLHFLSNMATCYVSFNPLIIFIQNPIKEITNPTSFQLSTYIGISLHIYHLLFFKCTQSDYFHHLTFVLFAWIINELINFGYIIPFYHFFIIGFPGGIDYLALALVKENIIEKKTRIKIAVEMNNWIRSPGIISSWVFFYLYYLIHDINIIIMICITYCTIFNSQYYNRQVTLYAGKKNIY